MSYKIVIDSCGELTEEMKASGHYESVAFGIIVDDKHIVDDETFNQAEFLKIVAESPNCPKSSCPSPEAYMEHYRGEEERVYVVTITSNLSGSYNSAVLGKNLYEEEYGEKKIHVFDSKGASVGETLIGMKIAECEEAGMSFEEVVETVEKYIESQKLVFVLETLETLRKNGRLTGIKAVMATALNIKPYMGATPEGTIIQRGQARGITKALAKMVETLVKEAENPEEKVLGISHCNCPERAERVRDMILEKVKVKDVVIVNTRGLSTTYANDGGVIAVI